MHAEHQSLQRLLDDGLRHGITEPAWLETDGVSVLVRTSTSLRHRGTDVSVTVHGCTEPLDTVAVSVVDAHGHVASARLGTRAHARVRGVGATPWTVRVIAGDDLPQAIMHRSVAIAAAAASALDDADHVVSTSDGEVTAVLREDEDRHLTVEFAGAVPVGTLVRLRWATVDDAERAVEQALVTPLAASTHGGVAAYDLGPLGSIVSARVHALELVPSDELATDDVEATTRHIWIGSARRAWREWLDAAEPIDPEVRRLVDATTR